MAQKGKNEGSWEENMYWNLFHSTRFFLSLPSGFQEQLEIPEKFVKKMKENLPETVALRGPGGNTWNVSLASKESTMIFSNGWQEFAQDHYLQENDLLMFRYNGNSSFDVLMIDPRSMCEKEAAYFVRKNGTEPDNSGQTKRKDREFHSEEHNAFDGVEFPSYGKPVNDYALKTPSRRQEVPRSSSRRTQKKACLVEDGSFEKAFNRAGEEETKFDDEETPFDAHDSQHVSNQRPVSEEEKDSALQQARAKAASTKNGFVVVMRPTFVSKTFHMAVPSGWSRKHLPQKNLDVILQVTGATDTWSTKFLFSRNRNYGVFGYGWKQFVLQNNLDESDVCVFEPIDEEQLDLINKGDCNTINMEVTIFHVV